MESMRTLCGTVLAAICTVFSCYARIVRDIQYDSSIGRFCRGDLFLPDKVSASTPLVLAIHGGGWAHGDRASWEGVARFFTEQLGFAAFNIEYRLASVSNRWPASGNDCVNAARFVLSDEFKKRFSLSHDKIWICGGSAGGHLALWTLTHLPVGDVAGCISISAIGDPVLDYAVHAERYKALFGDVAGMGLATMDPCKAIVPGMAPVLCTHAMEDKVVPIASHKAFADAYRSTGNVCEFFEYPATALGASRPCEASVGKIVWEALSKVVWEALTQVHRIECIGWRRHRPGSRVRAASARLRAAGSRFIPH